MEPETLEDADEIVEQGMIGRCPNTRKDPWSNETRGFMTNWSMKR